MLRAWILGLAGLGCALAQTEPDSANRMVTPVPPAHLSLTDRALGLIEPSRPKPLTNRERFHQYWVGLVGPGPLFSAAASAGISQWIDSPPDWHQGWGAYGKRLGNNLAFNGVRYTLAYGASSLFHEDNRYFASGKRGVWPRVAHAVAASVIARHDDGRECLSVSTLTGIVGASAISRAWSPPSWQGPGNVAKTVGLTLAGQAGFNLVREFVPDMVRHFRH